MDDHVPYASARFVPTGLLDQFGRSILKLRSKPLGFRADLDAPPLYAVDEGDPPEYGIADASAQEPSDD